MKARIKGETEWKEYKAVFGPYGEFQGLETAGYMESAIDNFLRLGGKLDPDDEFQKSRLENSPAVYISAILPLEAFDLWEEPDWSAFRREAAKDILVGMCANNNIGYYGNRYTELASSAITLADELVKQLQQ